MLINAETASLRWRFCRLKAGLKTFYKVRKSQPFGSISNFASCGKGKIP